jgi:hypothetical protein
MSFCRLFIIGPILALSFWSKKKQPFFYFTRRFSGPLESKLDLDFLNSLPVRLKHLNIGSTEYDKNFTAFYLSFLLYEVFLCDIKFFELVVPFENFHQRGEFKLTHNSVLKVFRFILQNILPDNFVSTHSQLMELNSNQKWHHIFLVIKQQNLENNLSLAFDIFSRVCYFYTFWFTDRLFLYYVLNNFKKTDYASSKNAHHANVAHAGLGALIACENLFDEWMRQFFWQDLDLNQIDEVKSFVTKDLSFLPENYKADFLKNWFTPFENNFNSNFKKNSSM